MRIHASINRMVNKEDSAIKAYASVTMDGMFAVHGLRVIETEKGRFVNMPSTSYTDKDGNKRSAVDIIAENVYFGDSKKDGETSDNASAPTTGYATAPSQNSDFANVGEEDGELPF